MLSPANIPSQIRARAANIDATLTEIAVSAGITRQHLNAILTGGRSNPRVETVARIAKALGCSVEELMEPVKRHARKTAKRDGGFGRKRK